MKATIVLIADNEAENFGRKMMLKAHRHGKMGDDSIKPGTYFCYKVCKL